MPTSDLADTSEWTPGSHASATNPANPTSSQFSMATRVDSGLENTPLDSEFELTSDGVKASEDSRIDSNIGKLIRFEKDGLEQILKLTKLIGIGGMGKVYEATSLSNPEEKTVAVKVAKRSKYLEKIQRRLRQETEILRSLDHQNIVRFVGCGNADDQSQFIVMEQVIGQNVVEYVKSHELSLKQSLELFLKICDAVSHCHQKGIIHRDIKPGNVLVNESTSEPVLIDFGIAKPNSNLGQLNRSNVNSGNQSKGKTDGQLIGTIQYMSPEQALQDDVRVDHRSDIYSLGALLYEILTGSPLVDHQELSKRSLEDIVSTIVAQKDPLSLDLKNVDSRDLDLVESLEWILEKAIQNDPVDRFESVDELIYDLNLAMSNSHAFVSRTQPTASISDLRSQAPKAVADVKQRRRTRTGLSRANLWQAISLCLVVAAMIAFGIGSYDDCPSRKNANNKLKASDNYSVLESLHCDSQKPMPETKLYQAPIPKLQQVMVESFYIEPDSGNTFVFCGGADKEERCYEKFVEIKKDKTRRLLIKPNTKTQWLAQSEPNFRVEVVKELSKDTQRQSIVRFQQVVERLDDPSLREVKRLIKRIPHKTLHRCMLLNEAEFDQTEFDEALDSPEF